MDQNPPVSPALYHARIVVSFILLFSVDAFMIYNSALAVLAVLPMGRPNIMVGRARCSRHADPLT